ncbi:hypothetical protein NMG60_11025994 [Bertholletia excelsa]
MKPFLAAFLIASLILTTSLLQTAMANPAAAPAYPNGCNSKCKARCSKAGYYRRCMKYCGICCQKCSGCVPSGTSGNKSECPCYRDMLNSKGKPKCP